MRDHWRCVRGARMFHDSVDLQLVLSDADEGLAAPLTRKDCQDTQDRPADLGPVGDDSGTRTM